MQILYVSSSYVPSRRASSVQVMNMCGALAARGHAVTLIAKQSDEPSARGMSDHAFYRVPETFAIEKIVRPKRRGGELAYAAGIARRIAQGRGRIDLVYSRELAGAALAALLGVPMVFESHGVHDERWQRALMRRFVRSRTCRGVIAISEALRADLAADDLLPRHAPVVVAHDSCEAAFGRAPREALASPPRIGYVGNLYRGRGIELVIELARRMPDCQFELVGGSEADIARIRGERPPANIVLHGFVAPAMLAEVYAGMDVMLMPHPHSGVVGATGKSDISRWTSPMKMFEYMASGVPMIASDLPVLGEVLGHGVNAVIARAGDADAWQQALTRLLADPALRVKIATRAQQDLRRDYTWQARAARVMIGLGLEPAEANAARSARA